MIDPQLLREQPDLVKASQERRGDPVSYVDEALEAELAAKDVSFSPRYAEQDPAWLEVMAAL